MGETIFDQLIIYNENDYRLEYKGNVKNDFVPHGKGTLTVKSGKSFTGNWVDGRLEGRTVEILREEKTWL